jgi:hypothetical protein
MNSNSKIPAGITIDIESPPQSTSKSKSFLGFSSPSESETSNSPSEGMFKTSGKNNYTKIGLAVIILLFLGVNIFSYLGVFFENLKQTSSPLIRGILESLGLITKDITSTAAEGAKLGVDVAAGTIESGIDVVQGQLDLEQSTPSQQSQQQQSQQQQSQQQQSQQSSIIPASLSSALADAEENTEPLPDDAMSSTQRNSSKSGYCYIGEDRGFRSCVSVDESDMCMSGDIFPSNEICVNPSLRE